MADEDEVEGGAGACVLGFLDVAHCRYEGVREVKAVGGGMVDGGGLVRGLKGGR